MQAIQVKYLSPSNVRGARLKARADAGSKTIDYPHELGQGEPAHRLAAEALAQKLGWDSAVYGKLVGGQIPDGSWVFCFAGRERNPSIRPTTRRNPTKVYADPRTSPGVRVYLVERDGRVVGWTTGYDRGFARGVAKKHGGKIGRQITDRKSVV